MTTTTQAVPEWTKNAANQCQSVIWDIATINPGESTKGLNTKLAAIIAENAPNWTDDTPLADAYQGLLDANVKQDARIEKLEAALADIAASADRPGSPAEIVYWSRVRAREALKNLSGA